MIQQVKSHTSTVHHTNKKDDEKQQPLLSTTTKLTRKHMSAPQSQLRFPVGTIVAPGDRLGSLRVVSPGIGTYARGGHVFASSVGTLLQQVVVKPKNVDTKEDDHGDGSDGDGKQHVMAVVISAKAPPATSQVLGKGQFVLCRVTRIMLQQVAVEIIAAANCPTLNSNKGNNNKPEGTIRREDVRHGTSSAEELILESCFRPGDWILGRIVSLGDARRYLISTAEPELGVVRATTTSCSTSLTGQQQQEQHFMQPTSLKEMKCPVTGRREPRKVAKANHEMLKQVLVGSGTSSAANY